MARKRWSDLSPRVRKLIVGAAITEFILKLAVLVDLRRRPASEIRGRKKAWASAMLVNSAGIIPASYFVFGRRRSDRGDELLTRVGRFARPDAAGNRGEQ